MTLDWKENDILEIAKKLARYVHSFEFQGLSPETVYEVKKHFIDSMGCMYGSMNMTTIQKIRKELNFNNPLDRTFIIGSGIRYLDFNDTYLAKEPAHPSDNISALLSLAIEENCSGRELISAIALSYEIQCRLCDAGSLRKMGWDHVSYIPISVACGASKLLNLNLKKIRNAIALATTSCASLRQTRIGALSEWKGLTAADAARYGLWATILAETGISGPHEIFEGKHGFLKQIMQEDFNKNFYEFLEKQPAPQKIMETYIKFYPIEYHIQAVAEAILELRNKYPRIKATDVIDKITVSTYEAAISIVGGDKSKWNPRTRETADHSIPYVIAVALTDGKIWLDQFTDKRIKDDQLRPLMKKIKIIENKNFTKIYGEAFPVLIEIELNSGEKISKLVNYPRGHYKNPMNEAEIEEKFYKLFEVGFKNKHGSERIKRLNRHTLDILWNLENETLGSRRRMLYL